MTTAEAINELESALWCEDRMTNEGTQANIADATHGMSMNLGRIANAICPPDMPFETDEGGRVGNLTEAAIFIGVSLGRIADALGMLAEAAQSIARQNKFS